MRARAILRSLISLDDLGQILALRFTIPNLAASTLADGICSLITFLKRTSKYFFFLTLATLA